jgi:hypothetical protein
MTTFEPPGALISHSSHAKTRPKGRVYAWLGWRDSNPRMLVPETSALPLGDTPWTHPMISFTVGFLKR